MPDDIHAARTHLLRPGGGNAVKVDAPRAPVLPSFAESTDEEIEHMTHVAPQMADDAEPTRELDGPGATPLKHARPAAEPTPPRVARISVVGRAREFADEEVSTSVAAEGGDVGNVTANVARKPIVAAARPSFGGSSDPPTRFLRGGHAHIELPSGSIVDDYEVDGNLGAGAMGVVYSAKHVKLGRRVALKVIAPSMGKDPHALARFEREARALASLHHPNIVDVTAFGSLPDDRSYFVMEYLVGETLDERLGRNRVPSDEALDILDQMARGLEAAHAQGIVHRDLKPSNTFLLRIPNERRLVVKLLDFGLAKLVIADDVEQTATGAVIGTTLYLSPEQCRSPNVDGRTDIYALGCIAYELVLGRHPFPEARTPTAALAAHLTEPPPWPRSIAPELPAALDLLMYSMLAKDPSYRPTLAQVRDVIAGVQSPPPVAEHPMRAVTAPVTPSPRYSRAWIAALVMLALLIGIAFGAGALGGRSSDGNAPRPSQVRSEPIGPTVAAVAPEAPRDADVSSSHVPDASSAEPVDAIAVDESSGSAPVTVDAGMPEVPIPSPPDGESPATPEGIDGQVTPAAPVRPPARSPSRAPARAGTGMVTVDSKPVTDVLIDGTRVGRTPLVNHKLSVGRHTITLINPTLSIKETIPIEIKQGQVKKVDKDYRPKKKQPDPNATIDPFAKKGSARR